MPYDRVGSMPITDPTVHAIRAYLLEATGFDAQVMVEEVFYRRLEDRARALDCRSVEQYFPILQSDVAEPEHLLADLCRRTTRFFQPAQSFDELRTALSIAMQRNSSDRGEIRVWVPACGDGAEAYAMTMVLLTLPGVAEGARRLRVFATECSQALLRQGMSGTFRAEDIEPHVPASLHSHWHKHSKTWTAKESLRRHITFACHDPTRNPPFPRLQAISCRNLLTWLRPEAREAALERIIYALTDEGLIFTLPHAAPEELLNLSEPVQETESILRVRSGVVRRMPTSSMPGLSLPPQGPLPSRPLTGLRELCGAILSASGAHGFLLDPGYRVLCPLAVPRHLLRPGVEVVGRPLTSVLSAPLDQAITDLLSATPATTPRKKRFEDPDGKTEWQLSLLPLQLGAGFARALLVLEPHVSEPAGSDAEDSGTGERLNGKLDHRLRNLEDRLEERDAELQQVRVENQELDAANRMLRTLLKERDRRWREQAVMRADLENLLASSQVGLVFLDSELHIRRVAGPVRKLWPTEPQDINRPLADLRVEVGTLNLHAMVREALEHEKVNETRATAKDGGVWLVRAAPYWGADQIVEGVLLSFVDISDLAEAQSRLERSELLFRSLAENVHEVLWLRAVDLESFEYVSPTVESLFGLRASDLAENANAWWQAVDRRDRTRVKEAFAAHCLDGSYDVTFRTESPTGGNRWVRDRAFPVRSESGELVCIAGMAEDVTATREQQERMESLNRLLREQAFLDPLTGILNRRGLEEALTSAMSAAEQEDRQLFAVLCDCDHFKKVNDKLGHAVGDAVLREVADRLRRHVRPDDVLARIGGDEFLVLIRCAHSEEALQVGERLRLSVAGTPLTVNGEDITTTASLGLSLIPSSTVSIEEILSVTHSSLAHGKSAGRNQVVLASTDGPHRTRTASSEQDLFLERIAKGRGIAAFCQPIVDLATRKVLAHEMLIRGPDGSYGTPEAMFRLLTERGALTMGDLQCFRACAIAARDAPDIEEMHINIFPSTLVDIATARLEQLVRDIGDPASCCIELSEQQFLGNLEPLRRVIERLRGWGLRIALDDVGFGRSSVEAIITLEPEILKIDKRLVTGLANNESQRDALSRLIRLTRVTEATVVAEGIEQPEEAAFLRGEGVTLGQGYHFGRPRAVTPPSSSAPDSESFEDVGA